MKCNEILQQIEQDFPPNKAYEWDNVGLLVGRDDKEIKKIYVALDATDAVIEDAITWGADMLLTHHPLIFSPLKKVNNQNFISNRIIQLIQADISYYAMHTNYDIVRMADLASEMLQLEHTLPLEFTEIEQKEGLGKIGYVEEGRKITINAYAKEVKEIFGLKDVKVFSTGDDMDNKLVKKVAILPGSGKSTIETAIRQEADILITGDIGHHEGIDASDRGLVILDAGHYGIEHIFIQDMCEYLERMQENMLEVTKNNHDKLELKGAEIKHPFYTI
ncbi:MAG: Nif3-like dinuclear metal center hexameric protein [Eubacteriales bacterium]